MVDVEHELLRPPSMAPLTTEPIRRDFPVLVGGPQHGEPVPVWGLNQNHFEVLVQGLAPVAYVEEQVSPRDRDYATAMYVRGKFVAGGSRRVLDVWYHDALNEAERSALTWLLILERAGLA